MKQLCTFDHTYLEADGGEINELLLKLHLLEWL